MVAYNKFQGFTGYLGDGSLNLHTDLIKAYLTDNPPSASADDVLADLAEFAGGTGYTAGGEDVQNTWAEVAGVGTMTVVDIVWSVGSSWAQFQYVVTTDTTHGSSILISWWDHGSALNLVNGESFTVDFAGNSMFTIT